MTLPRKEVADFAEAMEARLRANDHKNGWAVESDAYLLRRLNDKFQELCFAVQSGDAQAIRQEAADVANFAMMVFDHSAPGEEGR